jgi:hypothetical protein
MVRVAWNMFLELRMLAQRAEHTHSFLKPTTLTHITKLLLLLKTRPPMEMFIRPAEATPRKHNYPYPRIRSPLPNTHFRA